MTRFRRPKPDEVSAAEAPPRPIPPSGGGAVGAPVRLVHVTTVAATLGFLRGQIANLKTSGFKVWVASSPGNDLDRYAREEGVDAVPVEMARRITPWADLFALVRMWWSFVCIRPQVVHGHTPKGGLLAMIAAFLAGVPLRLYTVHGLPLETATGIKRTLLRWTERVSCLLAHQVHSVSPSLTRSMMAEGLCPAHKVLQVGAGTINGVDATRKFVPSADQFRKAREFRAGLGLHPENLVVGFIGRMVRDKGVADLAAAWTALRHEFPEAHLVMAGMFEPQDPVSTDVEAALRADPRVHLLGAVNSNSIPMILAAMDVVVLPTYREGFPQVPLEAAAMERPVVATRVTGCIDAVIHGSTGLIVPPRDPKALAAALRRYLGDPHLRQAHGRAGRVRVLQDFRPETLWEAWKKRYRTLPGARTEPRTEMVQRERPTGRSAYRALELTVKRVVDLAGALTVLVVAAPVMGLIALGTWATLGRPIFFRQVRPGLKGRPFTPLKFRTMRDGPGKDRERVTALGSLLRHLSLDELPQLWNVALGEMSLVGPRPLLMRYLASYTPRIARRHDMRPGLTGWSQVNGRNNLDWNRKFEFDVEYVENWSLFLDFKILLRTVAKVLRRSGVEGPGASKWTGALDDDDASPQDRTKERS